jgi:hypothetical protein
MADPVDQQPPVSIERIRNCLKSASFWVNELPRFADRQQRRADFWAIAAGILAAITSLAIFPVLDANSTDVERAIVTGVAFLAAVCALVPRIMNYGEQAGSARELSSRYGSIVGKLIDLEKADAIPQAAAREAVTEFEAIKEKKDALRGLPDRTDVEIRLAQQAERLAEAQKRAREAQRGGTASGGD